MEIAKTKSKFTYTHICPYSIEELVELSNHSIDINLIHKYIELFQNQIKSSQDFHVNCKLMISLVSTYIVHDNLSIS